MSSKKNKISQPLTSLNDSFGEFSNTTMHRTEVTDGELNDSEKTINPLYVDERNKWYNTQAKKWFYRVFAKWECTKCNRNWTSGYTWISLALYSSGAAPSQLKNKKVRSYQACKACNRINPNRHDAKIVYYKALEKKTGPKTQKRHEHKLCSKCTSGNPSKSCLSIRNISRLTRYYASDSSKNEPNNTSQTPPRSRRALFYVPGGEERKIKSSLKLNADSIVYDLEDGVAFNRKGDAREMVFNTLEASEKGSSEKAVRINAVGSGLELEDLNVVLRSKRLEGIVIPKVRSAKDVQFVSRMIDSIAPDNTRSNIRLLASIESAMGIMNIKEIFAAEDYCADLGMIRTPSCKELLLARQAIVVAASAYGLQAIDMVCLDFRNNEILMKECREGREMGFVGKQAIHPNQIDIIQKTFLPDEKGKAARIIHEYGIYSKKGIGAFDLDGKVIDLPVVKWAERLITRAKSAGIKIPEIKSESQA
nr:1633_t:CDS:10 [Entrophospora candida]